MDAKCRRILDTYHSEHGNVTTILQDMQDTFGYIPEDAVEWFSDTLNIPASSFYSIASFYDEFYLKPRGKHILTVCCDTACYVKGADSIEERLRTELKIPDGDDTSRNGRYTVEKGSCVGACSIAPVVTVGKKTLGNMTPDAITKKVKDIE